MKIYDFSVEDAKGGQVSLKDYEGKVILVVNTATTCGFTPQYDNLQDFYEKYAQKGFVILDFPCNQFENQAAGSNEEIISFCDATYAITFPIFAKTEVNGENANPLFTWLKEQKGFKGLDAEHPLAPILTSFLERKVPDYEKNDDIKWNFTKFLINREGEVVERFEATADMAELEAKIAKLL